MYIGLFTYIYILHTFKVFFAKKQSQVCCSVLQCCSVAVLRVAVLRVAVLRVAVLRVAVCM